jgi:hypothetical protein
LTRSSRRTRSKKSSTSAGMPVTGSMPPRTAHRSIGAPVLVSSLVVSPVVPVVEVVASPVVVVSDVVVVASPVVGTSPVLDSAVAGGSVLEGAPENEDSGVWV